MDRGGAFAFVATITVVMASITKAVSIARIHLIAQHFTGCQPTVGVLILAISKPHFYICLHSGH